MLKLSFSFPFPVAKCFAKYLFFFGIAFFTSNLLPAQTEYVLSGSVYEVSGVSLPGATVHVYPSGVIAVSDSMGRYFIKLDSVGSYSVEVRFLGYHAVHRHIHLNGTESKNLDFYLTPSEQFISAVEISEFRTLELQHTQSVLYADRTFLSTYGDVGLSNTLARLPGIQSIVSGPGITKPVIRGLSGQRLIVVHQDVKMESHQWGLEHGLEIDPYTVDRVQIIQGPSSLQYGSDGLAGLIRILPEPVPAEGSITGGLLLMGQSNQDLAAGSFHLGINLKGWYLQGRISSQSYGDFRIPADQFVYRSRIYPVENRRLKNTAGNMNSLSFQTGYVDKAFSIRFGYSRYASEAGFFPGIVGAAGSYTVADDGDSRNIELPKQTAIHEKISLHAQIQNWQHFTWKLDGSLQQNRRKEFSFPEFHLRPPDVNELTALQLDLTTFSLNLSAEKKNQLWYHWTMGVQLQQQQNERFGFDHLIPDFRTFNVGIFHLAHMDLTRGRKLEGGLRADFAHNKTDLWIQLLYAGTNIQTPHDSLISSPTDKKFFSWSGSLGYVQPLFSNNGFFKIHFGKSFRVPYPNETVSNGVHHGSFRHEMGNPNLRAEHGYQLDAGMKYTSGKISVDLKSYTWYFHRFIYLSPSAEFSPLPEAGQIFRYQQHNAYMQGAELSWKLNLPANFSFSQACEYNYTYNLELNRPLPFSPPVSVQNIFNWQSTSPDDGKRSIKWQAEIEHRWTSAQNRVVQNERPTEAYHLFNAALGMEVPFRESNIRINFQARNIFNAPYINHLSNYKLINLPEQGRNFVLSMAIPLSIKL